MLKDKPRKTMWWSTTKKETPALLGRPTFSPLRYGDPLKILLIKGFEGEIIINGKKFEFAPANVFLIPPRYLHTALYRAGGDKEGDTITSFYVRLDQLSQFIDLKNILLHDNRTLISLATRYDDFDEVMELANRILDADRSFSARLADQLNMFEVFSRKIPAETETAEYNKSAINIVNWIEEHYAENLTVQSAADYFGFSKYYFCKWFKDNTTTTFNDFLNGVRISHACVYLLDGYSVETTAELCGFADASYFIKVFKRFRNITPRAYVAYKSKQLDQQERQEQ